MISKEDLKKVIKDSGEEQTVNLSDLEIYTHKKSDDSSTSGGEDQESDDQDSEEGESGESPQKDSKSEPAKGGLDKEKLKDELISKVEKGSNLDSLLKNNRDKDMHTVGSHDEKGQLDNASTTEEEELDLEDLAGDPEANQEDDSEANQEELDQHVDDLLNNLLDAESEIYDLIKKQKEDDQADGDGSGRGGGLSDIHLTDKSKIVYNDLMSHVKKWLTKVKGDPKSDDPEWRTDVPSRRIPDLWGREMDTDPPEETTNKLLLFIFDTSGSMKSVAKIMADACSDIAIKMTRDETINRVAMLNFDGVWSSPKKIEPIRDIKTRMRRFLRIGTGSYLSPAWTAILTLLRNKREKVKEISGIVIVSDFEIFGGRRIPEEIRKLKPSILALNLGTSNTRDVKSFINSNTDVAIWGISVDRRKATPINTLKVGKK